MAHTLITGSKSGYTPQSQFWQYPQRLEFNDFVQVPGNLTLLVLALQNLQAEDENFKLSFFQASGIHGLPNVDWDNTPGNKPSNGYCIHGLNTFPTWHRPYIALYEQCLVSYFPSILQQYGNGEAGQILARAAVNWRFPYWDWALNPSVPDQVASESVQILSPSNTMIPVTPNPLHHYSFQSTPEPAFVRYGRFGIWGTTLRQPTDTSADAVSQPDVVDQMLQSDDELKTKVLDLFPTVLPQPDPWGQFSNHSWTSIHPNQGHLTSLEEIHDRIHGYVGGPGHMGVVPFSAFDPIFWLHHCMIDRVFALWQAVYPNVYVSPGPNGAGGTVDKTTPLTPFWDTQTTITTSVNCVTTTKYGYIYPELSNAQTTNPNEISSIVHSAVEQMYGEGSFFRSFFAAPAKKRAFAQAALASPQAAASAKPAAAAMVVGNQIRLAMPQRQLPKASNPHPPPSNPHPPPPTEEPQEGHPDYVVTPDTYQDWIVNVTIEKYALNGSGRVCFFIGPENEIPENPADWYTCPIYVGAFTIFAQDPEITECGNCQRQAETGHRIGGTVHLTKCLIRNRISLADSDPVPYLKENLHWRVTNFDDRVFPNEEIPSLKVIVQAAGYDIGPDGKPRRQPWTRYAEITRGRPGGVDHSHEF